MKEDPIIEEIRQVREAHAAEFNYDFWAIYKDVKESEKKSKRTYVSYAAKLIQTNEIINNCCKSKCCDN
ncbi:MAG: hypothetical protein KME29_40100 [Calothrix sp. FI2-JRJ7]|jgi:CRISPR/Cas system CMR-associated protein Cmr5 small subunit|nr:hypothetical protein [Calothrix sp. FI2-JRJ7]